eukprot:scaffold230104_cov33-Tisochrysis_lutea.AAC.6
MKRRWLFTTAEPLCASYVPSRYPRSRLGPAPCLKRVPPVRRGGRRVATGRLSRSRCARYSSRILATHAARSLASSRRRQRARNRGWRNLSSYGALSIRSPCSTSPMFSGDADNFCGTHCASE